ncbi:helix-turn-helix domain-containing protein [Streptomyces mirabilis]|uniref:helix-turn-helix domain-containing protein n=1 Tax=Streptomyces mirabilis TaxID=68239 RepID=UPI0036CF1F3D
MSLGQMRSSLVWCESSWAEDCAGDAVDAERAMLPSWVRRRSGTQSLVLRSRIVLESADGQAIAQVVRRLGITADTVRVWRRCLVGRRLDGLCDGPRPGVPRRITDADVERVIVKTLGETPKDATGWSTRSMAAATGMSQSALSRIWRPFAVAAAPGRDVEAVEDPLFIDCRRISGSGHW